MDAMIPSESMPTDLVQPQMADRVRAFLGGREVTYRKVEVTFAGTADGRSISEIVRSLLPN